MLNSKYKFLYGLTLVCTLMCIVSAMPASAASDNGCSDEDNAYITPELALCSTHVYNIGRTENQRNAAAKQAMRDVVALKSTVMMQQMYKQYEYLDATLSRLKTQLEREILTTKLEAAGASSSDTSSYSGLSIGGNNGVTGAENCMTAGLTDDVMNCLSRNLERITNAINSSDIGAAKRQIETDLTALQMYDKLDKSSCTVTENNEQVTKTMSAALCQTTQKCQDAFKTNNRQTMTECVNLMRVCITQNIETLQNQNRGTYNPYMRQVINCICIRNKKSA